MILKGQLSVPGSRHALYERELPDVLIVSLPASFPFQLVTQRVVNYSTKSPGFLSYDHCCFTFPVTDGQGVSKLISIE